MRRVPILLVALSFSAVSVVGCASSVEHGERAPACVGLGCAEGIGPTGGGGGSGVANGPIGGDVTGGGTPSGPNGGLPSDDAGGTTPTSPGTDAGIGGGTSPVNPGTDAGMVGGSPAAPGAGSDSGPVVP